MKPIEVSELQRLLRELDVPSPFEFYLIWVLVSVDLPLHAQRIASCPRRSWAILLKVEASVTEKTVDVRGGERKGETKINSKLKSKSTQALKTNFL